jgi:hypothetical protein
MCKIVIWSLKKLWLYGGEMDEQVVKVKTLELFHPSVGQPASEKKQNVSLILSPEFIHSACLFNITFCSRTTPFLPALGTLCALCPRAP